MHNAKIKALISDFDGVVSDSMDFHYQAIQKFSGISLSYEDFAGMHDGNFFAHTLPKFRNVDWEGYKSFVFSEQQNLVIQEECRDFFEIVASRLSVFIVTSGGERNVSAFLENNCVRGLFQEILGLETSLRKVEKFRSILSRHGFALDEVVFVTDTLGDILEAAEVGIRTIAVDFGFHDRQRLERGNPYRIVSSFEEILTCLKE
jgi:phosphoglycolate phosphatase-like HAD superfamily hydrolase